MLAAQLHILVVEPRSAMPGPPRRPLPAGVRKLHAGRAAKAMQEIGDALELRNLRIVPQAVAARRDPSLLGDRGRFDEDEAGAAEREAPEMHQMKIVGKAVVRAVHRHRRHHNAVAQRHATKGYRLQQKRCGCGRCDRLNFPNRHGSS